MPVREKVLVWVYAANPQGEQSVLLLKTNSKRGSFWQPVTGSVDSGEEVLHAAKRELFEETGFSGQPKLLGYSFSYPDRFRKGGTIEETCFECEAPAKFDIVLDPSEHQSWCWVSPEKAVSILKFEANAKALALLMKKWKFKSDLHSKYAKPTL